MSELVERTGVAAATVRYYLAGGLLPPPRRAKANRFLYDERHVEVIRLIRLLQDRRNLSLETIGRILPELFPDLAGVAEANVFRPEMWSQVLAVHLAPPALPSPSERLQEAGLVAFSHHGYADVSVDDVCQATGIAKGSFYRHFSSKEELFFATAQRVGHVVADALANARPASSEEAVDALAEALRPYLAIVCDLVAHAAQRRPGYARALRSLVVDLARVAGVSSSSSLDVDDDKDGVAREQVMRAIAQAMTAVADEIASVHSQGVATLEPLHLE